MLHQNGSERLASLRDAIARIETRPSLATRRRALAGGPRDIVIDSHPAEHDVVRKPVPAFRPHARVPLGRGGLRFDAMLGGGLRRRTLHEIVAVHRRDDGAAAGFATGLALRFAGQGSLVWIVEDCAAFETGFPYCPGLAGYGLATDRLVLVRTRDAAATLWAVEEALRLRATVVLAELWGARHYGLAPSRRLLLAARTGGGTALLLHTGLSGRADDMSSAAETRFAVAACPSPHLASAGHRLPIPGPAAFAVRLTKQRLGTTQGFDRDHVHGLLWNAAQRCFDDHPVPFGLPAEPADRPVQAPRTQILGMARHA